MAYIYFNANPKEKKTDDCVIRAISTALSLPYNTVYRELAEFGIKRSLMLNCKECYEKYLITKGFKKVSQLRKEDNTLYECKEFCDLLESEDVEYLTPLSKEQARCVIAAVGSHHLTCFLDYDVYDIFCPYGDKVHTLWVKED